MTMIIDINTYIGHWPFRKLTHNTPLQLGSIMDNAGIDLMCVSNLNSIFYRNSHDGNKELFKQIQSSETYKDRFLPFAIINPAYPAWEKDFLQCINNFGMKGLELYPYYHNYRLTDRAAVELINLATQKGIPVHLPCALENHRQRHWLDVKEDITADSVKGMLSLCPDANIIISNGSTIRMYEELQPIINERKGKVYFDFSRVNAIDAAFVSLILSIGTEHIVFGSAMPFQYIDTQMVKLHFSKLAQNDKDNIMYKNLQELLNL